MKTRNKALLLALCAGTLVTSTFFGTMAYLTDKESVTNTFTVGKVGLTLNEAWVNANGDAINESEAVVDDYANAKRVNENDYHLLPGHTYVKDPTVTVYAGSEDARNS